MFLRSLRPSSLLLVLSLAAGSLVAEPLSKKVEVDFFRDVPSRNLKGLATRSDGRLVAGPVLTELTGAIPADLLWCLEPTTDAARWLVGSGPDGKIFEVTLDVTGKSYTATEVATVADPQVFALRRLVDGSLLVGTSPKGGLSLVRDGKVVARVALPVDSIFDLLLVDEAKTEGATPKRFALVGTGNPGRIYRVDLEKFAKAGLNPDKISDDKLLAEKGIVSFGEIRDRNVRRLARFPDGRVIAGSAPKANLYVFPAAGGTPLILQENREAEVTDLLPQPNGDLYATFIFAGNTGEARINRPKSERAVTDATEPIAAATEKFSGRSTLVWFPANGFPETLVSRGNLAFYRVARHGDMLVVAGGDSGEVLGYHLPSRLSLTFAGSSAAQLNGLSPLAGSPGCFLILKNNAPGLALLDFNAKGARQAETRRLELGLPSTLGAVRFNRLRSIDSAQLKLTIKTNFGSDELEGWTIWSPLAVTDGGWRGQDRRGRYVKLRLELPETTGTAAVPDGLEIDKATIFHLPQNRRPALADFRLVSPNYGLIPAAEPAAPLIVSLSQLLSHTSATGSGGDVPAEKKKSAFLNSQIAPQPGTQVVLWSVTDADDDTLTYTFSLRREGETAWTEIAVGTHDSYAQFDISHLPEGIYFTRLVAAEQAPRPVADRLTASFETDDLVIDRTPPEILEAKVERAGSLMRVTVRGRDALSLLDGVEFGFNNGPRELVEQPRDGIRDGREETFVLEIPLAKVADATSLEIVLYDAAGNSTARRMNTK